MLRRLEGGAHHEAGAHGEPGLSQVGQARHAALKRHGRRVQLPVMGGRGRLMAQQVAVGPGGVTQLKNGRIVAPVWLGGLDKPRRHDPCQTGSIYSDDGGKTWNAGEIIDIFPLGPSEAQIAPLSDGGALISLRNQGQQHKRGFAWSPDGAHWSKPVLADNVCEVNCQGSLISVGDLMVITGPEPEGDDIQKRERKRLTLRVSRDGGHTWSKGLVLVEGTAGYSALALQPDGALMCLYETWEDEDMLRQELLTITPDEFEKL